MKNKKIITLIIAVFLTCAIFFLPRTNNNSDRVSTTPSVAASLPSTFSYVGREGKDALSLLKETTHISQNSSGLVTAINGRAADATNHEYWAFYVNGKMASVGPHDYITKTTDRIEWRIETY